MKKKICVCFGLLVMGIFFICGKPVIVCAADTLEEDKIQEITENVDSYYEDFYDQLQIDSLEEELNQINKKYGRQKSLSVESVFSLLMEGEVDAAVKECVTQFYEDVTNEIIQNREILIKLVLLVIVASIFHTYSSVFKFSYVGEQGFFVTYLMIAILLLQSFSLVYDMAKETVCYLKEIMECLLPAFYMSIILCSGLTTSHMVNTMFLWMLSLVEKLLLGVVLPGIRIYFLIVVLNQVNERDRFSKLASLLKQGLQFLLKAIVTGIISLNVMKSILVPIYDNAKYNVLQKGLAAIPGGTSLSGLSTILVGAGVLIKNCIGLTAVIILLVFGSIPLLEILCFYVVYKVIVALVQPVSDNRILAGIQGAAESTGILLRATATSMVLSVLSIAIVIISTNVRLYTG